MSMRFEMADLERAIADLMAAYPELADDEQLRADMLTGSTEIEAVLTRLIHMIHDAEDGEIGTKARVTIINDRKARYERKQDALRSIVANLMQKANLTKLTLPHAPATVTLGSKPIRPEVFDASQLPDECVHIERKPVMDAIKAWHAEKGTYPPGVGKSNGGIQLTIRSK